MTRYTIELPGRFKNTSFTSKTLHGAVELMLAEIKRNKAKRARLTDDTGLVAFLEEGKVFTLYKKIGE